MTMTFNHKTLKTFNHRILKREDFGFQCDAYSYQITYKGKSIGGMGIDRKTIKNLFNISHFSTLAENAINDIIDIGKCPTFMKQNIMDVIYYKSEWWQ